MTTVTEKIRALIKRTRVQHPRADADQLRKLIDKEAHAIFDDSPEWQAAWREQSTQDVAVMNHAQKRLRRRKAQATRNRKAPFVSFRQGKFLYVFPKPLYREVLQSHGKRWQATRNEDIIDKLMLDYGDTERTAVHEAGHAVFAHVLGLGVSYVTCRPELRTGLVGETTHYRASHAVKQGWIRTLQSAHTADILGAMAGIEAEYRDLRPASCPVPQRWG